MQARRIETDAANSAEKREKFIKEFIQPLAKKTTTTKTMQFELKYVVHSN